jgi:hypothetical protein
MAFLYFQISISSEFSFNFFSSFFFSFKEMEEICLIVTALYANIKD